MSIIPSDVVTAGRTTAVSVHQSGLGFRIEPSAEPSIPVPRYPVRVVAYRADGYTVDEYVMRDDRARFAAEGFSRLDLYADAQHRWEVTVYKSAADWDEKGQANLSTVFDNGARGGAVLRTVQSMTLQDDFGNPQSGVRNLVCDSLGVPRLARRTDGVASPLRVDSDGRLQVALPPPPAEEPEPPSEPVLLRSDVATGTAHTGHELPAGVIPSWVRTLWLRIYDVELGGGGTVTPVLRSVGASNATVFAECEGVAVAHGGCGEVQVGPGLAAATVGQTRVHGARLLRPLAFLRLTGITSYSVRWELWAER